MNELQKLILVYKNIGETPLEALERVRKEKGISDDVPMTYAGRLDPMAEGLLLILVGEECKKKEEYLGLDKEYIIEVLFGVATDTEDVLGKIKDPTEVDAREGEKLEIKDEISNEKIQEILNKCKGRFVQEYPAYSSKTVNGEQLHLLANEGRLPDQMPTKEVEIYSIELLEEREIGSDDLLEEILNNIKKVKGEFRQEEIMNLWQESLKEKNTFKIIKIKVSCSSGAYMRTLAERIGKELCLSALAYSIKRTRVGGYLV